MAAKQYPVDAWASMIYTQGVPIREVAELAGVTSKVVRNHLIQAGYGGVRGHRQECNPSSHSLSNAQVICARVKREAGMSWKELGEEYKMSENRILGILRYQCLKRGWDWPIKIKGT